jgi:hypothetical protein
VNAGGAESFAEQNVETRLGKMHSGSSATEGKSLSDTERAPTPRPGRRFVDACEASAAVGDVAGIEILGLTWRQVDFGASTVRLEPGTTKNREGRTFHFTPELRALLEAQRECTATAQAKTDRIIPNVFHRDGEPIKSFRGAWFTACESAGVPGRIFHDLRRTAVRNLERAGVPRSVAMKLTGHKTEAVYRRYAIVSDADLRDAAVKLAAIAGPGTGTTTGTVTMIRRA